MIKRKNYHQSVKGIPPTLKQKERKKIFPGNMYHLHAKYELSSSESEIK